MKHKRTIPRVAVTLTTLLLLIFFLPVSPALGASLGPNDPDVGVNQTGVGTVAWTDPGNITTPGAPYATASFSPDSSQTSNYLIATDYDFNIPAQATILGVTVVINRYANTTPSLIRDNVVSLVYNNSLTLENKENSIVTWPNALATATYGAADDTWGTAWTPAQINDPSFGVALSITKGATGNRSAYVDSIQITVTYTDDTTTSVNCGGGTPVTTYGTGLTCVATVTRTLGTGTPTGSVSWGTNNSGTFSPSSCSLTGTGDTASCSVSYTPSAVGGGSHLVTATYSGDGIVSGSSGSQAVTVNPRPVTVTADAKTKTYGDTDPALTYQVTSGSLVTGDAFTGALTRAAGENVGTHAIQQGTLALTANYNLTYVGANLTITARPVTVTADAKTKVYGAVDPALTYQVTSGSLVTGDAFTGALTRAIGENVDDYAIQQGTLALTANYDLTYVGANLTITARPVTVTADAKTKAYGEADPPLTYQVTSGSLVTGDAFTGALTRAAGEDVGNHAILQGTLALSTNYDLTYVGADLTITTRPVTVTADAKTKVYGEADPPLTYAITSGSLLTGDDFTGALARAAGEDVGTHAIQQGTLALPAYYNLTYVGADLTITARPVTVTADAKTKVYGEADPPLTYQITSGTLVTGDDFTGALARAAGEDVGPHAILQDTLALSANYDLTYVGADLTITVRPVTVTADPQTKMYGEADPALTYQVTSGTLVTGDDFTGALARAAGEDVGNHAILQGTLALSANYDLTYVGADLTITPRPVTVTADAKTKAYGEADPPLTYQVTSGTLVTGDAFTGALTREAGEDVGVYAIQQGTLALSANYELTFVGADLTIEKATPTLSVTNSPVVYTGLPQEAVVVGSVPGTVSNVTYDGSATPPTDVGTYAVAADFTPDDTDNYNSLSGASAGNFDIEPVNPELTLAISPTPTTFAEAGDVITYTYTLTNSGNVPLVGPFSVEDDKVTVTCPEQSSLDPGSALTCTGNYTITAEDVTAGSVTNTATAAGEYAGDPVVSDSAQATVTFRLRDFILYLPIIFR